MENLHIIYGLGVLPLKISNFEIACFILSNEQRVFSIKDVQKIFYYEGKSDFWLANILKNSQEIPDFILDAYENPTIAHVSTEDPSKVIKVIDARLFIETCRRIASTESDNYKSDLSKLHKKATAFYKITENEDVNFLIEEASGYIFQKESVKKILSDYLQQNLNDVVFTWLKTIPDSFFETLFKTYSLNWKSILENIPASAKICFDTIFSRLSEELLLELRTEQPKRGYIKKGKSLRNAEHPKLRNHIASVSDLLQKANNNRYIFLQLLQRAYPTNSLSAANFPAMPTVKAPEQPSIFSQSFNKIS